MTNPWAAPDRATAATDAPKGLAGRLRAAALGQDVAVGAVVGVAVLLLAAPAGLLWSALAPHADVVVQGEDRAGFARPEQEDFIGSDGTFLLLTLLLGVACGLVAWRAARRWGPAVVVALAIAGLGASAIAAQVGTLVGRDGFRAAVESGAPAELKANVRLMATEARVAWPIGALLGFLVPLAYRRDPE